MIFQWIVQLAMVIKIQDEESCIKEDKIPNNYFKNDELWKNLKMWCGNDTIIKYIKDYGGREINCNSYEYDNPIMYNNLMFFYPDKNYKYL